MKRNARQSELYLTNFLYCTTMITNVNMLYPRYIADGEPCTIETCAYSEDELLDCKIALGTRIGRAPEEECSAE